MSCYKPLIRIEWPIEMGQVLRKNGKITCKSTIMTEHEYFQKTGGKMLYNATKIPCGQCIGCRLDYSREWANRITLEAKKYKDNLCWFITITYDDEHLPLNQVKNEKTGEIIQGATLCKKDLTDFIKRLRRHYEYNYNHQNIRFYAAGEYGETTKRPHYHICFFNLPIYTELKKLKNNELGQCIWTNEEIEKIWGKGFIAIAKQSWETAAYTARYMLKKQKGENADWYYKSQAIIPEFTQMSRKPGIAKDYYEKNKEKIYQNDEITLLTGNKVRNIKPPKYYDNLYDIENHNEMEEIKLNRRINAQKRSEMELTHTTKTEAELRKIKENNTKQRIKKLKRSL